MSEPAMTAQERERELRAIIEGEGRSRAGGRLHMSHIEARELYLELPGEVRTLNVLPSGDEHREYLRQCYPSAPREGFDRDMLRILAQRREHWWQRFPCLRQPPPGWKPPQPNPEETRRKREAAERATAAEAEYARGRPDRIINKLAAARAGLAELPQVDDAGRRADIIDFWRLIVGQFAYLLERDYVI
jgi:hypothetical protein